MAKRYGCVKGQNVYLMDKATKSLKLKGKVVIQSLATGDTAIVNKSLVKKVSRKYPGESC